MLNSTRKKKTVQEALLDKRKTSRLQQEILCQYTDLNAENRKLHNDIFISDISETGLRFRAFNFIPMNHRLAFTIEIPKKRSIQVTARPVWIKECRSVGQYNVGVVFDDLPLADRMLIQSYLQLWL